MADDPRPAEKQPHPIPVLAEFARAVKLSWQNRWPLLVYGFAVAGLSGLLLSPLFTWLLYRGLALTVGDAVVNFSLASFAASLPALVLFVVWSITVSALTLIGLGGPVLILTEAACGRRASLVAVAARVARSLPRAASQGAIRLTLLVVLAMPLAGLAITLLSAIALLPFGGGGMTHIVLPDNFIATSVVFTAVLLLGSVCFYFYVRWTFCLHFFLVDRLPLGASIAASVRLVKGRFWALARIILLRDVFHGLVLGATALLLGGIQWVAMKHSPLPDLLGLDLLVALLLVLNGVVMATVVILTTGNAISLLTGLYLRLREEKGSPLEPMAPLTELPADARTWVRRRPVIALVLVLASLALGTWLSLSDIADAREELGRAILVTAHRGNTAVAPENTLAAIRAAIDDRADYAEIDILEAKDGTLVVIHDSNLKRLAGLDKNVYDMTGEELGRIDVGSHFDPKFSGEKIPTLEAAIQTAGTRLKLNIELKVHGREKRLVKSTMALIHRLDFGERCVITSLDADVLAEVRSLDPSLPIGIILSAYVGRVSGMDVDFYSVNSLVGTDGFIREAHADGRDVHVWTLNEPDKIRLIIDRFPDNIITDYPARVRDILDARGPEEAAMAAVQRLFRK